LEQNGQPQIVVEDKTYAYPYEKVRSLERDEETALETEKKSEGLLPYDMGKEIASFSYERVKPAEPCELCGVFAVEYKIVSPDGTSLRRCASCFKQMRDTHVKAVWKNSQEAEDEKVGRQP
jgi:hypothetical protein